MADKLTPQQAQAISDRGGNLLVSAAAGSGKTKVLVDRLLSYLTHPTDPANLDEFLIITYTKAAASELRGKIAQKLTERIAEDPDNRHLQKQMQRLYLTKISTVHGFCGDLLREYSYHLDLSPDFRVADESECRELRDRVLADLLDSAYSNNLADPDFVAFVDTQGLGRTDALVPQILEKVYDSARCHRDPDAWLESCLKASQLDSVTDISQTQWGNYLMEDLREYLSMQIRALEQCVEMADACPGYEKVAINLRDTMYQLEHLSSAETWDEVVRHRNIEYSRLTFPRKNAVVEVSDRIKAVRNACKAGLEKKLQSFSDDSAQMIQDLEQTAAGTRGLIALVKEFDRNYFRLKHSRHVLDFGDLEHKTLDLLLGRSRSGPTAAAAEISQRFREIMVDEYQDSNGVQDTIFSVLTQKRHNCFMVGDVKQSIYQFRLAEPGIFLNKYGKFADADSAAAGEDRKILLSHNFRSGGEVIEAVNDVFSACMTPKVGGLYYGEAEALREGVPHEPLPEPAVELHAVAVEEETYPEEAAFVADRISSMLASGTLIRGKDGMRPVQPEDIVILLRSPNSIGSYFQRALDARGIPCDSGGGTDLLHAEEIATLRAFLQVILNPRQDIPLVSVLASPVFGFTADDLAQIRSAKRKDYFYEALAESEHPKARAFMETLAILRETARMEPLTTLLEKCFRLTKLDCVYSAMYGGTGRNQNLQEFFQIAADFESGSSRELGQFLEYLESMEGRGLLLANSAVGGCVTIMSIHKSKGLEFPVVFLSGLSRGFNKESLRAQILCDKKLGLGLSVTDTENRIRYPSVAKRAIASRMMSESLSEEMRVLYVAMTRARDRLVMTYAAKNLEADLQDIALRLDIDEGRLLCSDASCPGDWVMMCAMKKREAGQLHALGGRPRSTRLSQFPWLIRIAEENGEESSSEEDIRQKTALSQEVIQKLSDSLSFVYSWPEATAAPSKQTATGIKGRNLDAEAAEHAPEPKAPIRSWRKPGFVAEKSTGVARGNAFHLAMQYIRYENCGSVEAVQEELSRLGAEGYLTQEQIQLVDHRKIAAFFETPVGKKLISGVSHLREFKFSILDDAAKYGDGLEGEQVLLQGVVDCAILEEDGIIIVDFKSDYATQENLDTLVKRYTPQLQVYSDALARIYEKPVKETLIYFLGMSRFVRIG